MSDAVTTDPIACWDTLLAQAAHVLHHPEEAGFAPRLEALADAGRQLSDRLAMRFFSHVGGNRQATFAA